MSDGHVIHGEGTITVPAPVLAQVVRTAVDRAGGARLRRPRRGLGVEIGGGRARVGVELAVRRGTVLPQVAEDVQRRVAGSLRSICGLETEAVDVASEELDG